MRLIKIISNVMACAAIAVPLAAQSGARTPADALYSELAAAQRAEVTRAELESSLQSIEAVLASGGYSDALKAQKQAEADLIRRRLAEGDLHPGDVVRLAVAGVDELSGLFAVTNDRTIIPPGAGTEISVANLLRSEVQPYLREQMKRFVRDPLVVADAQIRVQIFGGVGRQGFFLVSSSSPINDVIMTASGGPSGNQKIEESKILRGDRVIVDSEMFMDAIRSSLSLDQLNLQAGDEIRIGERNRGGLNILAVISTAASLGYLATRIF